MINSDIDQSLDESDGQQHRAHSRSPDRPYKGVIVEETDDSFKASVLSSAGGNQRSSGSQEKSRSKKVRSAFGAMNPSAGGGPFERVEAVRISSKSKSSTADETGARKKPRTRVALAAPADTPPKRSQENYEEGGAKRRKKEKKGW